MVPYLLNSIEATTSRKNVCIPRLLNIWDCLLEVIDEGYDTYPIYHHENWGTFSHLFVGDNSIRLTIYLPTNQLGVVSIKVEGESGVGRTEVYQLPQNGSVVQLDEGIMHINDKKPPLLLRGVLDPHKKNGTYPALYNCS